jgi:hypothetical protein
MELKPNEHVFCAGMTQSGKTFLTQSYLANSDTQVYVLDTKGLFNWPQVGKYSKQTIKKISQIGSTWSNKVIYRPEHYELCQESYNDFFEFVMTRKDWRGKVKKSIIVVDEVMQVCPNSSKIPEWYKGVLTRGMELGIGVWSLTQRPKNIPITIISESTHYFIFRLNSEDDRKRIYQYSGFKEFMQIVPKKVFWYFNATSGLTPIKGTLKV